MDEFPGIHFVDGALGRRPSLVGTGLDVWEVVQVLRDNDGSTAETAVYLEIEPRLVQTRRWLLRDPIARRSTTGSLACMSSASASRPSGRPRRSLRGLRLLLDEHFSPKIAPGVAQAGSRRSRREGAPRIYWPGPIARTSLPMQDQRRAIVTQDLGDFRPLLEQAANDGERTYGLICEPSKIRLRRDATGQLLAALDRLLKENPDDDAAAKAWWRHLAERRTDAVRRSVRFRLRFGLGSGVVWRTSPRSQNRSGHGIGRVVDSQRYRRTRGVATVLGLLNGLAVGDRRAFLVCECSRDAARRFDQGRQGRPCSPAEGCRRPGSRGRRSWSRLQA